MTLNAKDIRRVVTTSRAGHVWLTLIHKATGAKVKARYGYSTVMSAMGNEYAGLVDDLTAKVALIKERKAREAKGV